MEPVQPGCFYLGPSSGPGRAGLTWSADLWLPRGAPASLQGSSSLRPASDPQPLRAVTLICPYHFPHLLTPWKEGSYFIHHSTPKAVKVGPEKIRKYFGKEWIKEWQYNYWQSQANNTANLSLRILKDFPKLGVFLVDVSWFLVPKICKGVRIAQSHTFQLLLGGGGAGIVLTETKVDTF